MSKELQNIVIIGSGNLATHLALALKTAGLNISHIYSRTQEHAKTLATKVDAPFTTVVPGLVPDADIYIFAVSDSAMHQILRQGKWEHRLLVHTAGSVPAHIFQPFSASYGVIYPFQTFTKERAVDFSQIPLFIEGSSTEINEALLQLCQKISSKVLFADSTKRAKIHLAGVFANNYANHMFSIASKLLEKNKIPVEYLYPLILETATKALEIGPLKAQTGPAVRHNREILSKHAEMLADDRDWQKIYTFVAENIIKVHKS